MAKLLSIKIPYFTLIAGVLIMEENWQLDSRFHGKWIDIGAI